MMDIIDEIKREIARTELMNDMAEGMTAPKSTVTLEAALGEIERLRGALVTGASLLEQGCNAEDMAASMRRAALNEDLLIGREP